MGSSGQQFRVCMLSIIASPAGVRRRADLPPIWSTLDILEDLTNRQVRVNSCFFLPVRPGVNS